MIIGLSLKSSSCKISMSISNDHAYHRTTTWVLLEDLFFLASVLAMSFFDGDPTCSYEHRSTYISYEHRSTYIIIQRAEDKGMHKPFMS
jgi:hypothetical protein